MNILIKQFASKHALYVDGGEGKTNYTFTQDSLTEFTELIVKECLSIVEPTQHHQAFAQGYLGDVEGLELLDGKVKQIKQHFGVE
jgi:hypothetical protein